MSLPTKQLGQWDAPAYPPNHMDGFTLAENAPVKEVWKGPVTKDASDFEKERKEAERAAAANQPAASATAPPPRPVPTTLADALAIVSRFVGELPGEPDITAARRHLKTCWHAAMPKPYQRANVGGKDIGEVSEEGQALTVYLLEQLAVERARISRLEERLRDMAEAVAVLVAKATPMSAADSEALAGTIRDELKAQAKEHEAAMAAELDKLRAELGGKA